MRSSEALEEMHIFLYMLAQPTIPSTARWSENAITVAGSWSGQFGSSMNLLEDNHGFCIMEDGTLYVADTGNHRIMIVSPNSTKAIASIQLPVAPGAFSRYVGVFVVSTDMYVLDNLLNIVSIWSVNRLNLSIADTNSTRIIQINMTSVEYFFIDGHSDIYITDPSTHTIKCYRADSINSPIIVAGNGVHGSEQDQLASPRGIFVDAERSVYIADSDNHRIQKWSYGALSGVTVAGNGECGSDRLTQLCHPVFVTVDSNQHLYTFDRSFGGILRWSLGSNQGECIAACSGVNDLHSSNLGAVYAIAFDRQGSLYASDPSQNRIQKFQIISDFGMYTCAELHRFTETMID